jgi:hypothetical protein
VFVWVHFFSRFYLLFRLIVGLVGCFCLFDLSVRLIVGSVVFFSSDWFIVGWANLVLVFVVTVDCWLGRLFRLKFRLVGSCAGWLIFVVDCWFGSL